MVEGESGRGQRRTALSAEGTRTIETVKRGSLTTKLTSRVAHWPDKGVNDSRDFEVSLAARIIFYNRDLHGVNKYSTNRPRNFESGGKQLLSNFNNHRMHSKQLL